MLVMVNGGLGSGKSLLLTILASTTKKPIVSNFKLHIKYEKFDLYEFMEGNYSDCLILLDEVYQYIDSRNSMKDMNRFFSYVLFQSRKKNLQIYIASQLSSSIDIRYRQLTDLRINCEKTNEGFQYTLFRPSEPYENRISILPYNQAKPFFKLYDTNEIIMDTEQTNKIKYMSNEDKLKILRKVGKECIINYKKEFMKNNPNKKKINKITRPYVKIWAMEHNIEKGLVSMLYNFVKAKFSSIKINP